MSDRTKSGTNDVIKIGNKRRAIDAMMTQISIMIRGEVVILSRKKVNV